MLPCRDVGHGVKPCQKIIFLGFEAGNRLKRSKNKELATFLEEFDFGEIFNTNPNNEITIKIVENTTEKYDFQSQVNFGVANCETEYFTLLEFDISVPNLASASGLSLLLV